MTVRYPRPPVLREIPAGTHAVLEASAGTGKTYALEHLLVDLLLRTETRIENLLVVTFTERATIDLKVRVRTKLRELLELSEDPPGVGEDDWTIDEDARTRLASALASFDAASISTIHGFCQRVLIEHAFLNRRLFGESAIEGRSAFEDTFKSLLRTRFAVDAELLPYLRAWLESGRSVEALSEHLWRSAVRGGEARPVYHPEALREELGRFPLAALSGPRFGLDLGKLGLHPATAQRLVDRVGEIAAAVRACQQTGNLVDFLCRAEPSLSGDAAAQLREHLLDPRMPKGPVRDVQASLRRIDAAYVGLSSAIAQRFLPLVLGALRLLKDELGTFDFDDMLELVEASLHGPHGETLTQILRRRYRFGLIDEFQDTDEVQWRIFRKIFYESEGRNLVYLIGDPKQAIYAFRGADVHTYLSARREIESSGGRRIPLTTSYRSQPRLLEAINEIFDQDVESPLFTGEIRYDRPVDAGRPELVARDASGQDLSSVVVLDLVPARETLTAAGIRRGLGAYIAEEVRRMVYGDEGLEVGEPPELRRVKASDIYVLTRTTAEAHAISDELRRYGVPFAFYKEEGLFDTKEARHIRDLLRAIDDPSARSVRLRALMTPFFGVPLVDLELCIDLPSTHPMTARLFAWRELAEAKRYESLFSAVLDESGLIRRELFLKRSERDLTNYLHIFEILLEEVGRNRRSLRELIQVLQGYMAGTRAPPKSGGNIQRLEGDLDAVQVMTMHKSKGLEAEVVFVAGGFTRYGGDDMVHVYHEDGRRVQVLGDDGRGTTRAAVEREWREEEQRLLYVALTRARSRVYLPHLELDEGGAAVRFSNLSGCYAQLNTQLARILSAGPNANYLRQELVCPPRRTRDTEAERGVIKDWTPAPELLKAQDLSAAMAGLHQTHAGFSVTSYSRVKETQGGYHPPEQDPEDFMADGELTVRDAEGLPGGATTGVFLHELLEHVPLSSFGDLPFESWRLQPEIVGVVEAVFSRYDVDPKFREYVERMLYLTLTEEVGLRDGRSVRGLCRVDRAMAEMEFLYPIPEPSQARLGAVPVAPIPIKRGFVKGFVDFVFEQDGLVYFADWKSDQLLSWDAGSIRRHVELNYQLQAQLYSLAMIKAMRISTKDAYDARFGGLLYVFLRGMVEGNSKQSAVFLRPSFEELVSFEDGIREDPSWGGLEVDR